MYNYVTDPEIALRFYEGDVNWDATMDPKEYWTDPKMYNSLNCLLSPNLADAVYRVNEGKLLNLEIVRHLVQTREVCRGIYHYAVNNNPPQEDYHTYRVDRAEALREITSRGVTTTFTSTSKAGFLKAYADKIDIGLMEFHIPNDAYVVDLGAALSHYAKAHEEEVLIPPFIKLDIHERQLTEDEMEIRDKNGNPPQFAFVVITTGWHVKPLYGESAEPFKHDMWIDNVRACERVIADYGDFMASIYEKFNHHEDISEDDMKKYKFIKDCFIFLNRFDMHTEILSLDPGQRREWRTST